MKLIDLLVQETKKGNFEWPEGVSYVEQYIDLTLFSGSEWSGHRKFERVDDFGYDGVTREQYEAAIAAVQKPVWNGEGLPPVGCEFEFGTHRTRAKCLAIGHHMIFASKGDPDDEDSDFEEFMISIMDSEFHPIRTEAERKRDETLCAMKNCVSNFNNTSVIHAIEQCYDAIAAGKILGVKLSD